MIIDVRNKYKIPGGLYIFKGAKDPPQLHTLTAVVRKGDILIWVAFYHREAPKI